MQDFILLSFILPNVEDPNFAPLYGKSKYSCILTGSRWRWVVSITPRPLYPRGKNLCAYRIGGWVGRRAGMDGFGGGKNVYSCRYSNAGPLCSESLSRVQSVSGWHDISCLCASRGSLWGSGGMAPRILKLGCTNGEWSVHVTAAVPSRIVRTVPAECESGWAPRPVLIPWGGVVSLAPAGNWTSAPHLCLQANHSVHWTVSGHYYLNNTILVYGVMCQM